MHAHWSFGRSFSGNPLGRVVLAGLGSISILALALPSAGCGEKTPPAKAPPAASAAAGSPVAPGGFPFRDVTAASGVAFVHDAGVDGRHHYVETMAPGLALFDADGDGDLDLYVVNGGPLPGSPRTEKPVDRLYRNRGDGTFEDVTAAAGVGDPAYGMGVAVGDADGDGDLDLYVANYGPNSFFRNDGSGRFERVVVGAEDPSWSVSAAFLDGDGDGDLDLYVANYLTYDVAREKPCKAGELEIYCSPEQFPPASDRYFENLGNGRFVDATARAGVATDGRGMGVGVGDFDGDGKQDLYVANDRTANFLYLNRGGRFEEVAAEVGAGYGPTGLVEGGMGVVVGDLGGQGRAAIFVTNFQKEPNRFYLARPDGFFDELALRNGLGFPSIEMVGWGIGMVDVEGDGDLDLAVANGHVFENAELFIPGSAYGLPDHLYLNDGTGSFTLQTFPGTAYSSRGLAAGDLDGDGDEDLVIAACNGPLKIWRNEAGRPERLLVLGLEGEAPNTRGLGARVTATVGGRTLRREVTSGGSYASASDTRVVLGLGAGGRAERVEIRWPDGRVDVLENQAGGREIVVRAGTGAVSERTLEARP